MLTKLLMLSRTFLTNFLFIGLPWSIPCFKSSSISFSIFFRLLYKRSYSNNRTNLCQCGLWTTLILILIRHSSLILTKPQPFHSEYISYVYSLLSSSTLSLILFTFAPFSFSESSIIQSVPLGFLFFVFILAPTKLH